MYNSGSTWFALYKVASNGRPEGIVVTSRVCSYQTVQEVRGGGEKWHLEDREGWWTNANARQQSRPTIEILTNLRGHRYRCPLHRFQRNHPPIWNSSEIQFLNTDFFFKFRNHERESREVTRETTTLTWSSIVGNAFILCGQLQQALMRA